MLDAVNKTFDLVSVLVQFAIDGSLDDAVFLRGNHCLYLPCSQIFQKIVRVVALVREDGFDLQGLRPQEKFIQKRFCLWRISGLAGRERNF